MTTNHPTIRDQLQTLPSPQQLGLLEDAVRVVVDGKPRDWDEDLLAAAIAELVSPIGDIETEWRRITAIGGGGVSPDDHDLP